MPPLAFARSGAGAPLVLLHALGLSRRVLGPGPARPRRPPRRHRRRPAGLRGLRIPTRAGRGAARRAGPERRGPARRARRQQPRTWPGTPSAAGSRWNWPPCRPVASLTLLSPAGLWRQNTPLYDRVSLQASRWLAQHAAGSLSRLVASRLGRALVLGQTHGHPMRLTHRVRPGGRDDPGPLPRLRGGPGGHGEAPPRGRRAHSPPRSPWPSAHVTCCCAGAPPARPASAADPIRDAPRLRPRPDSRRPRRRRRPHHPDRHAGRHPDRHAGLGLTRAASPIR